LEVSCIIQAIRTGWTAGNTDYTGACLNASGRLERKLRLLGNRPGDSNSNNNIIIIIRGKHHLDGMSYSGALKLNAFKGFGREEGHRYKRR